MMMKMMMMMMMMMRMKMKMKMMMMEGPESRYNLVTIAPMVISPNLSRLSKPRGYPLIDNPNPGLPYGIYRYIHTL